MAIPLLVAVLATGAVAHGSRSPHRHHAASRRAATGGYTKFNLTLSPFDPVVTRNLTWANMVDAKTGEGPATTGSQLDSEPMLTFHQPGNVSVPLFGTDVRWYGDATGNTTVQWTVTDSATVMTTSGAPVGGYWGDSASAFFDNGTSGGGFGYYDTQFIVDSTAGGSVSLTSVVIETGLEMELASFDDVQTRTMNVSNSTGQTSRFFKVTGSPTFHGTLGTDSGRSYPHMILTGADQLTFSVPAKASFMIIHGAVSAQGGGYEVDVNPNNQPSDWSNHSATVPGAFKFNSSSPWEYEATMFYMPLDPDTAYNVGIRSDPDNRPDMGPAVGGVTFYYYSKEVNDGSAAVAPTASKINTGLIVGVILGAVALIAAIGLAVYFFRRYKKKNKGEREKLVASFDPADPIRESMWRSDCGDGEVSLWFTRVEKGAVSDKEPKRPHPPSSYRPPVSLRPFWDPRLRLQRTHSAGSSITELESIMSDEVTIRDSIYVDATDFTQPPSSAAQFYSQDVTDSTSTWHWDHDGAVVETVPSASYIYSGESPEEAQRVRSISRQASNPEVYPPASVSRATLTATPASATYRLSPSPTPSSILDHDIGLGRGRASRSEISISGPIFAQEKDAGTLMSSNTMELIPPSYNPAWARSRDRLGLIPGNRVDERDRQLELQRGDEPERKDDEDLYTPPIPRPHRPTRNNTHH